MSRSFARFTNERNEKGEWRQKVSEDKQGTKPDYRKIREEHKKLSEMILAGTDWYETLTVRGVDGKDHEVRVYAVSDHDLREAIRTAGIDAADIGNREKLLAHMDFTAKVACMATGDPELCKALVPGEAPRIAAKAFELSKGGELAKKSTASPAESTPVS